MGLNYVKQLISCEDMTSQTDNHLGNLCCDSHCFIVLHTFSKIHNFLISYPILLKLFLIGLSDFSAFIESNFFFEWTCPLRKKDTLSIFLGEGVNDGIVYFLKIQIIDVSFTKSICYS